MKESLERILRKVIMTKYTNIKDVIIIVKEVEMKSWFYDEYLVRYLFSKEYSPKIYGNINEETKSLFRMMLGGDNINDEIIVVGNVVGPDGAYPVKK